MKLKDKLWAVWAKGKSAVLHYHPHFKPYYPHAVSFVCGVVVTSLFFSWQGSGSVTVGDSASDSLGMSGSVVDWSELADDMCSPNSTINHVAMKFDFPFESCLNNEGEIDKICVEKDAIRFKPKVSEPFQQSIGDVQVRLDSGEGWTDMHYLMPLHKAVYHGMPLSMLAVRIETDSRNELLGWQTPYLVVQDDFSKIKEALRSYSSGEQYVYYADIPPEKDILSGPFETEERAKAVSKKAGGNPNKITRQTVKPEAEFNDKLNAVTLGCVSQLAK